MIHGIQRWVIPDFWEITSLSFTTWVFPLLRDKYLMIAKNLLRALRVVVLEVVQSDHGTARKIGTTIKKWHFSTIPARGLWIPNKCLLHYHSVARALNGANLIPISIISKDRHVLPMTKIMCFCKLLRFSFLVCTIIVEQPIIWLFVAKHGTRSFPLWSNRSLEWNSTFFHQRHPGWRKIIREWSQFSGQEWRFKKQRLMIMSRMLFVIALILCWHKRQRAIAFSAVM